MKKILLCLVLSGLTLTLRAQLWNGTNPAWTLSNIGIGTSTPDAPLTVYGISNFYPRAAGGGDVRSFTINYALKNQVFANNDYPVVLATGGGNQPLILDAPRIGVGTVNPQYKLDVYGISSFHPRAADGGDIRSLTINYALGNPVFINNNYPVVLATGGGDQPLILDASRVGIGTVNPQYKLDVIGSIRAREIKVDLSGADFVFEEGYKLMPVNELEKFVKQRKHLPEVLSARQMEEDGTNLGSLNSKLLQKIEELTLYMIKQDKKITALEKKINVLSKQRLTK